MAGNVNATKTATEERLYTIGEVSRLADLKSFVLRYWESEIPMLQPTKDDAGRRNRQFLSAVLEEFKLGEFRANFDELTVAPDTLEDLTQDQVGKSQSSFIRFLIKPFRFWIEGSAEVIHPYRGINNDHACAYSSFRPRRD